MTLCPEYGNTDRIVQVPGHTTIQLLPLVEDNCEEHQVLTDVIMNAAIKAAENVLLRVSAFDN